MDLFLIVAGSILAGMGLGWHPARQSAWQDGWNAGFGLGYQAGASDEGVIQDSRRNLAWNNGYMNGYAANHGHVSEIKLNN